MRSDITGVQKAMGSFRCGSDDVDFFRQEIPASKLPTKKTSCLLVDGNFGNRFFTIGVMLGEFSLGPVWNELPIYAVKNCK